MSMKRSFSCILAFQQVLLEFYECEIDGHYQACYRRMQICEVLTLAGAGVIFKPECIPGTATVASKHSQAERTFSTSC